MRKVEERKGRGRGLCVREAVFQASGEVQGFMGEVLIMDGISSLHGHDCAVSHVRNE
jgi:hypothetical protein